MLHLIQSNYLEVLSHKLADVIEAHPLKPLQQEEVVVQNAGMGRWLSLQLAERLGVAANMRYIFPAEVSWELLRATLKGQYVPERDPCSPKLLRWRLFHEFLEHADQYPELHHYLKDGEGAAWQLAQQVAGVFDGYVFFRPHWIQDWQTQPLAEDDWQGRLWRRVVIDQQLSHGVQLQQRFAERIVQGKPEDLPERLLFFSVPALSAAYIELINQVAQYIDVYFFLINPSREYWSDVESERRRLKFTEDEQALITVGNPLLASWGRQGRDFISNLREQQPYPIENEYFVDVSSTAETMLDIMQSDILRLEGAEFASYEYSIDLEQDHSIRFHDCHSPMREVEVLHDQLLRTLETNPTMKPSDIVVMMPDIDTYAPYIEAIFGVTAKQIPFSVADQSQRFSQSITSTCLQLLELPDSRFEAERLFTLLESDVLRQCLGLDEHDVEQCRVWVSETNIRWGIDADSRRRQRAADTFEHTWRYGLDRLLLGYAMPSDNMFEKILPYNQLEGSQADVLGQFLKFVNIVFKTAQWRTESYTMTGWAEQIRGLLQALFLDLPDVQFVYQSLDELVQAAQESELDCSFSWRVFRDALKTQLDQRNQADGFLGRGVTFCALMPMRSVPFEFVALLGMQHDNFPRLDNRISFDRMAKTPRKRGDRSRRDEDRYLFLESVLSARSHLYISYVGQSIYDNSPMMPSILVSELQDYFAHRLQLDADDIITKHPLQAFSKRYFIEPPLFTYANQYAALLDKSETQQEQTFWSTAELPELEIDYKHLSLDSLIRYFRQPARVFLQQRLGVQIRDYDVELSEREPFALEDFADQAICRDLFAELNAEYPYRDPLKDRLRALGLLPHGTPGDLVFNEQQQKVETFYKEVLQEQVTETLGAQSFHLSLDDFELHGTLGALTQQGREVYHFGKLSHWQWIDLWLQHLVLNMRDWKDVNDKVTTIYALESSYCFKPIEHPQPILEDLLHFYWQGLHQPLPFLPKSSLRLLDNQQIEPALRQAQEGWTGVAGRLVGELEKPEHVLLYRGRHPIDDDYAQFEALAKRFYEPMLRARETLT